MNYAILDSSGLVINTVLWDGLAPWRPPANCMAIPIVDSDASIGWTFADGQFIPPTEA